MTAVAIDSDLPIQPRPGRYRFRSVAATEWTKMMSVSSTVWTVLITAVVGVGLGALVASAQASRWTHRGPAARLTFDPTRVSLSGLLFAQLAVGVLGVLVVSGEYSSGTIRATFSAVPRRPWVLAAKAVVFGSVMLVVGEVVSVVAFLVGQQVLSGKTPTASLSDPASLRAVLSGGLYLAVLGLLALGLATIVRHTAGSISAFVGLMFVLPIIADVLPSNYASDISRFLPTSIGTVMVSAHYFGNDPIGPWAGFAILCGYAVVALVVGGILLVRRDA